MKNKSKSIPLPQEQVKGLPVLNTSSNNMNILSVEFINPVMVNHNLINRITNEEFSIILDKDILYYECKSNKSLYFSPISNISSVTFNYE